jgi:8-oxo-dGTP diphosphatase
MKDFLKPPLKEFSFNVNPLIKKTHQSPLMENESFIYSYFIQIQYVLGYANLYIIPTLSISMPHIHDKIDFTVEVYIIHNNKVLLRKHDKYKVWLSVGGHIELDEDSNQAAIREVKEEVGLDVELYHDASYHVNVSEGYKDLIPPQFMNRHRINETHEHITLVYFAKSDTDKLILSETEKAEDCRWFSKTELDDPKYQLKSYVRHYAKTALEKLLTN